MTKSVDADWLRDIIQIRSEHETVEFKRADISYQVKSLCDYCVAISNELGGRLVFGVTDKHPRQIVGTGAFRNFEKICNEVLERVGMKIRFTELTVDQKRVLVVDIPSRPQGVPRHHKGKYLMRAGESLAAMSVDELTKIINENKIPFEHRVARENCTEEDVVELLSTETFYKLLKKTYPAARAQVIDEFIQEKLIRKCGDYFSITNLGAVTFAHDLKQFESLAHKSLRVVWFDGNSKSNIKQDAIGSQGFAVGFEGLFEHLAVLVPFNVNRKGVVREESYVYPMRAIRELVANAIIHQDFDEAGRVTIELFESTLNVRNAGKPIIDPRRFIDSQHSRNESMAHLMRRLGFCEELGSGIDIVVEEIEANGLPPYKIITSEHNTTISLLAPLEFDQMTMADRSVACFQHCVLVFEKTKQPITNLSVRTRFGLSDRQGDVATRIITQCIADGLIKLEDPDNTSKKYARYVPFWA